MQRAGGLYLLTQGALGGIWWLLLWLVPETRAPFVPLDATFDALLAFWLADGVAFVGGSIVAGVWVLRGDARRVGACWFVAGASVYAALYCVAVTAAGRGAVWATILMTPAAFLTVLVATRARRDV